MYEVLLFEELKSGRYTIFVGRSHYYIGEFVSGARFKNVFAVFKEGYIRMFQDQYFVDTCVFHRFVSKEEIQKCYRNAFERRAVNQIISSILHHPFTWY